MVGNLPAQAIDADLGGHPARQVHLLVAVVVREQDVAPVHERHVEAVLPFLVRQRRQIADGFGEVATLPVLCVALRGGAVNRESDFVDP